MAAKIGITLTVKDDGSVKVESLGKEFDQTGQKAKKSAKKTTKAWKATTVTMKAVTRSIKGVGSTMAGIVKRILSVKTALGALGIVISSVWLGKQFVDFASDFQTGMTEVSKLVDTSIVDMEKFKSGVLGMTTDVGKSGTDLAAGLYQTVSAGVAASDSLDFLRISAIAAAAGSTDTLTSVDALTTVINAYGLKAGEVGRVSDLMFQTVKQGKTTFPELASQIGMVISPAAATGVKLEELFAILATLTKGGLNTATAVTSVRATLMSILGASDETKKAAKAIGLEWSLAGIQAKGLVGILRDLKEKTGGSAEAMRKFVPESRALTGVLTAIGEQESELVRITGEMVNAQGAAGEAFEKETGTFKFLMTTWSLWIDRVYDAIGSKLLPVIADFVELDLMPLVEDLLAWADANADIIATGLDKFLYDIGTFLHDIDFKTVWEGAQALATYALEAFWAVESLVSKIGSWVNKNKELIGQGIDKLVFSIIDTLEGFDFDGFISDLSITYGKIVGMIESLDSFVTTIGNIWDRARSIVGLDYQYDFAEPTENVPEYSQGTNYIPRTGLALLHRGEAVIPASQNQSQGQNNNQRYDNRVFNVNFNRPDVDPFEEENRMRRLFNNQQRFAF